MAPHTVNAIARHRVDRLAVVDLPRPGEEAYTVLACLAGLTGQRPKAAASALAELVRRRGLEQASEVLLRWAAAEAGAII